MKLIVLMGLVAVEKHTVALDLAQRYTAQGHSVALLDNVARLSLPEAQRIEGDALLHLPQILAEHSREVVIVALSERAEPAASFAALDALHDQIPGLDLQVIALIDTRTCDCFPQMRESLEMHADTVLHLPLTPKSLVEVIA